MECMRFLTWQGSVASSSLTGVALARVDNVLLSSSPDSARQCFAKVGECAPRSSVVQSLYWGRVFIKHRFPAFPGPCASPAGQGAWVAVADLHVMDNLQPLDLLWARRCNRVFCVRSWGWVASPGLCVHPTEPDWSNILCTQLRPGARDRALIKVGDADVWHRHPHGARHAPPGSSLWVCCVARRERGSVQGSARVIYTYL